MRIVITAAILGAFSPLTAFVVWNAPAMTRDVKSTLTYPFIKLMHVAVIAFAGIAGTVGLFQLLTQLCGSKIVARRLLFVWLAGNLFLGSQICWVLRPFIWDPAGPTRFIGREYFRGSFYETVFEAVRRLALS